MFTFINIKHLMTNCEKVPLRCLLKMPQGKNLELIGCLFDLKVILFICLVSEVTLKLLSLLSFFFKSLIEKII